MLFKVVFNRFTKYLKKRQHGNLATLTLLFICFFLLPCIPFAAILVAGEYSGTGILVIVSPDTHRLAVELEPGNRPRIIGGSLTVDAILLKDNNKSDLHHFNVGEKVQITWRDTTNGKEVVSLISGSTSKSPIPRNQFTNKTVDDAFSYPTPTNITKQKKQFTTPSTPYSASTNTIIGKPVYHVVGPKETMLDIARDYSLGYLELTSLYPDIDPWLPPVGQKLLLPTEHLLPDSERTGIVINIAELRLYHFRNTNSREKITTYPVGIGGTDYQTPPGNYTIGNKAKNPTWTIPPSLRTKYTVKSVPPGPNNPLGKYWLGLKNTMFGIHGTDIPWAVGRMVTHGCIRMYPEDIEPFFPTISVGTRVQIIYQPVKFAKTDNSVFMEVHQDIYEKIPNLIDYARELAIKKGLWQQIDQQRFTSAMKNRQGIPINVSKGIAGGSPRLSIQK